MIKMTSETEPKQNTTEQSDRAASTDPFYQLLQNTNVHDKNCIEKLALYVSHT